MAMSRRSRSGFFPREHLNQLSINNLEKHVYFPGTVFETPDLTNNEKDVLCHIHPNKPITGAEILGSYERLIEDLHEGEKLGLPMYDLSKVENIKNMLPDILASLVAKGAISQTTLDDTHSHSPGKK